MTDLGALLFDQANQHNRMYLSAMNAGRQQVAREVEAWIKRNADALGMAHTESLLAICKKEVS